MQISYIEGEGRSHQDSGKNWMNVRELGLIVENPIVNILKHKESNLCCPCMSQMLRIKGFMQPKHVVQYVA